MNGLFRFRKMLAVLAGAGATVALAGIAVGANGPSTFVQPCDPSVQSDCVEIPTTVLAAHRRIGPTMSGNGITTVVTLGNVPPGNYVAIAKTDIQAQPVAPPPTKYAFCGLVVTPPGAPTGFVDEWEEQDNPNTLTNYDLVANLQAAITLNPAIATSYTIQLECQANVAGATGIVNFSHSSIILTPTLNLQFNEVNS